MTKSIANASSLDHVLPAIHKTPVFINPKSGSAERIIKILENYREVGIQPITPKTLPQLLKAEIDAGYDRVIVCGGDGTLALAAHHVAKTKTALAVLPGGTLNHFAQHLGLPTDIEAALEIALKSPNITEVDVGYVNNRLFLNTSSVGNYVRFVRTRDYLERYTGYLTASVVAGVRRLIRLRSSRLYFEGEKVRSPLAFIGVKERELSFPALGQKLEEGEHGLHVIVVRAESRWEMIRLTFNAMIGGIDPLKKAKQVDSYMVEEIEIDNHHTKKSIYVALDGEITLQKTPLHYYYARNALKVVLPPDF